MSKKLPDLPVSINTYLTGAKDIPAIPPSGPKAAEVAEEKPKSAPAKRAKAPAKKAVEKAPEPPAKPKMPWDDIDATLMQPFSTRIKSRTYEKLQYVATHKHNITKIVNDAVDAWVEKMIKERG